MSQTLPKKSKSKKAKEDEVMDEDTLFENAMSGSLNFSSILKEGETYHAPDALDFEDEDELAEEEDEDDGNKSVVVQLPLPEQNIVLQSGNDDDDDDLMNELEQEGLAVDIEEDNFGHKLDDMQLENIQQVGESDLDDDDLEENESPEDELRIKEQEQRRKEEELRRKKRKEDKILATFYPDFKDHVVMKMIPTFSSVDYGDYAWYRPPLPANPLIPTKIQFEVAVDEKKIFNKPVNRNSLVPSNQSTKSSQNSKSLPGQRIIPITDDDLKVLVPQQPVVKFDKPKIEDFQADMVLATCDWDDDKILAAGESDSEAKVEEFARPVKKLKIGQYNLDDWVDDNDIFEGQINLSSLNLKLDTNDPHMLFFKRLESKMADDKKNKSLVLARGSSGNSAVPLQESDLTFDAKFDISNDKLYEILRANYHSKVRSTIGNLSIEHSSPATRLQYPYYRIKLDAKQARLLHRPQLHVRPNSVWLFSKVKKRKSKKDKGKTIQEIFNKSTDLTLGDSANFFLLEYTEENPLALSNFGMASKLINYYRKRNDEDTTRPRLVVGETHVLGVQDKSPFWNFGFVEPGNVVPALYNRMVRAPIFKQEAKETDFLLVRSTGGGTSNGLRYYIRQLNHIFTVGQQFPAVEIPGPHSRKVTSTSKNRLKMIVYRCLNRSEHQRLSVRDISAHFPDQNDMQNRQRLKEFMEYQRSGDDQGYWKVKSGEVLPNYEQIRNMITPEDISLLESMASGDQYLNDIMYYYGDEKELEKQRQRNKEKSNYNNKNIGEESIEEQLAPWNITRNFLTAVQGKLMLQIHGEGDPSGRGNAFSFLRTSMKGGFKSSIDDDSMLMTPGTPGTPQPVKTEKKRGRKKDEDKLKQGPTHKYNVAVQQKLYEEEIAKVWYTQQKVLTDEDNGGNNSKADKERIKSVDSSQMVDEIHEGTKILIKNPEPPSAKNNKKILKITRMVRDSNGILQRKTEVIKDAAVIKAYVERKIREQVTSLNDSAAEVLGPTADPEQNERMKKALLEEIERLEKSKERRKKKGPHKKKRLGEEELDGSATGSQQLAKKSTNRKCKRCGSTGHISTNKKLCPMYKPDGSTPSEILTPNSESNYV